MKYKIIAAGGTFDHIHEGHKAFLLWLFSQAEQVILGITSDIYTQHTKITVQESFSIREEHVREFLDKEGLLERTKILSINDLYGPLLEKDFSVDALGVTTDTLIGAENINAKRQELGLNKLPVLIMSLVIGQNGQAISSTAIRAGEMNKKGDVWVKKKWETHAYVLPQHIREKLHEPFGSILSSIPQEIDPTKIITVGDVTTKLFNMHTVGQKISVIDFVVERTQLFHSLDDLAFTHIYERFHIKNPAGHIVSDSWNVIRQAINSQERSVIHVEGEEDLLVLPCILLAPLEYHIFYGQPHVGLVDVVVTLEAKHHAFDLMKQFGRVEL